MKTFGKITLTLFLGLGSRERASDMRGNCQRKRGRFYAIREIANELS